MEMVPIFGPALGAIPALLVAFSVAPGKAIWVVVATVVIQMLENAVLVPRIMKNSLGVNPIIVLLSLIAFSSVFGIAGATARPATGSHHPAAGEPGRSDGGRIEPSRLENREVQVQIIDGQEPGIDAGHL